MKRIFNAAIFFVAAAICISTAAAAQEEKLHIEKDIVYVERDGGKLPLKGDLYRPDNREKLPGLVLAHGGGFVAGARNAWKIPEVSQYLASRGFVVFAIDYRTLQQGGLFPKNALDMKCAIQWLRANAAANGVDPARIAAMGMSAGGYLTSFAAVTQHNAEFNASCGNKELDARKPELDLAVAWYGVHDFTTLKGNLVSAIEKSYFPGLKDNDELKRKISPITYAADAPPMLMVHGTADQLVPIRQSQDMCAAMLAAGRQCKLVEFPGASHGFIDEKFGTGDSMKALEITADWLNEQFAAVALAKASGAQAGEITCRDIFDEMPSLFNEEEAADWTAKIQYKIEGEGGGNWIVDVKDGKATVAEGIADYPTASIETDVETWIGIYKGTIDSMTAFMTGKMLLLGSMADVMKCQKVFEKK